MVTVENQFDAGQTAMLVDRIGHQLQRRDVAFVPQSALGEGRQL